MAVIGKIQKNSYLLLIVIGLAMLAFIFTDNFGNIGKGGETLARGTMFGESINEKELGELEESYIQKDKQNFAYQGKEFDEKALESSKDQAFNEIIRRELMDKELSALGFNVSSEELNDMISGAHIHPWVSQIAMFKNNIGEYSRDSVARFIENLEAEPDGIDTARYANWKEARTQWSEFEKELKNARSTDKYVSLIKKGIYVNTLDAKDSYLANKETRDISFVVQKYGQIPQDEVEFSDDDIRTYYNAHKTDKKFYQEVESAEIEFVEFPVNYSEEDLDRSIKEMTNLKASFEETELENTIYFMATKGEDKIYSDSIVFELGTTEFIFDDQNKTFQYPESIDEEIQASKVGDVIGPFVSKNVETNETKLVVAKVTGFAEETQKRAWVRHILISTNSRTQDAAKSKSDSIIKVINANNNFTEMVDLYSDDPGSKASGGEYKWFKEGDMVTEFNDASFNGPKGKLQLVKTTYGYHIIEVLGRGNRKMPKLAPVRKTVKPGAETIRAVENTAYEFVNEVEDSKIDSAFYKVSNEKGLIYNYSKLYITSNFVTGFEKANKIKKFAFAKDAIDGDISEPILDNNIIKVAFIRNKISEGVPEFDDIKDQMKTPALRDKQAKLYLEKMAGSANLEEIATSLTGAKVQTANIKFGSNAIAGAGGNEGELVGTLFSLAKENEGAVLAPIQGESGVYVIVLNKINEVAETEDFTIEGTTLLNQRKGSSDGNVMRALREKAGVKDNRQIIEAQGR